MLTTCYVDGVKVTIGEYKKVEGKDALCPLFHKLVAKKGKKVIHHFAHYPGQVCDPWKDRGMSHWHSQWQKIVLDKTNLEVCLDIHGRILGYSAFQGYGNNAQAAIVASQAESHIADIIRPTATNSTAINTMANRPLVIEIQHSSVSKDKIDSREKYYQRMIWLFDLTPRLVTPEKCSNIVMVDGRLSYLKEKVTYVAMISCPQAQFLPSPVHSSSPTFNSVAAGRTFDQIELLMPNNNNVAVQPNLCMSNVTNSHIDIVYCKGDECEYEALTPVSGFFMIISTRTKYWLDTTKPTYFDCGFAILRFLLKLNQTFILVQYLSYEDFMRERMPPINVETYTNADWFKTISPALLIKLRIIPRMIDVARIQLCKNKVILHHKGLELDGMGLEQGLDDWHAGSFYVNASPPPNPIFINNPADSPSDLMTRMLRQATSGVMSHSSSTAVNVEAMIIVKLRKFLGVSANTEIKIVNRKGAEWIVVYCNNETYNLKEKFKALEMTYRKGASDNVSNRQSLKNTHSVIQSVVTGIPLSKTGKETLYDKETRTHYQAKLKIIEGKLAIMGL